MEASIYYGRIKKVKVSNYETWVYTVGSSTMPKTKEIYRPSSLRQQKRKLEAGRGVMGAEKFAGWGRVES